MQHGGGFGSCRDSFRINDNLPVCVIADAEFVECLYRVHRTTPGVSRHPLRLRRGLGLSWQYIVLQWYL